MASSDKPPRSPFGLAPTVWVIGLSALLNDAASEAVYPLLPLFLTTTLGVKGSPSCVDNTIAPKAVLAIGKKTSLAGITCSSAKKGVTCIKANGHGFFISRASYKLF